MFIRGGDANINPDEIAQAIRRNEPVVISRRLDADTVRQLGEEVSKLAGRSVTFTFNRGRWCSEHRSYRQIDRRRDDYDGQWFRLDPEELALATVLA